MKLVFSIKSLSVPGGGAERVLVEVANGLVDRGHEVVVVTLDQAGSAAFYPIDPRIGRVELGMGRSGLPMARRTLIALLPRYRRAILELRPDLVVGFMHSMYVPATLALAGTGIKVVASEHIDAAHYRQRPLQALLAALARRLCVAMTVPVEAIRRELPETLQAKCAVLANPVDLSALRSVASKAAATPPRLLAVGRFMAQKNHAELIAAFVGLAPDYPQWVLRIVGDGELRSALERQVRALGLEDRIAMPGVVRDIASEYAAASIVVVPSTYESFGLVTAEALASGRPVVGFAGCRGTAELVQDGCNGLLLADGGNRVAALSAGLSRLMGDSGLRERLAANGPASVQRFAVSSVLDSWEHFLVSLARGPDPSFSGPRRSYSH